MKIGILSRKESLYSTRRLKESAEKRGHEVKIIDYLHCSLHIVSQKPQVIYQGKSLDFDAFIPRIGATHTVYGVSVIRQFEMMGVYPLNESQGVARSRDKLRSLQLLSRKGIPLPVTGFARSTKDIDGMIQLVGGVPLVIKLVQGTQGKGVILAETNETARSIITAFLGLEANILVQEFIAEAKGEDLRAMVVGDQVVAAIKRQAKPGEFRANLHLGGKPEKVELTQVEQTMAVQACMALGLNVAGVDIIRSKRGPLVLEVNSSPGLEGIEKLSQFDVANSIIEYIEKNASRGKTQDSVKV